MDFNVILCSCPNIEIAKKIATHLVENKLAACVNIIPNIISIYRWQNKIEKDNEILLLIKTSQNNYSQLEATIQNLHPYDTPEIIALQIEMGSQKYLSWLQQSL